VPTNRTADFFVNWNKVRENAETHRIELSLMNSLIGSDNIEDDFKKLIKEYPEAIRAIPILIAVRDLAFPVIIDFFDIEKGVRNLDFNKNRHSILSENEIDDYLRFTRNSGLFILFEITKNLFDYVVGVEVGMDTNARKNRSGEAMEQLIKPVIEGASKELGARCLFQRKFNSVGLYGRVPNSLANRKTDFIVYKRDRFVNIEVNYYSGAGSKPEEIVDSYINRKNELETYGWDFIWITDGNVWKGSESQLTKAFQNIDYVFNINFSNRGLLKAALNKILQ
jgi:type II restriction enzyme